MDQIFRKFNQSMLNESKQQEPADKEPVTPEYWGLNESGELYPIAGAKSLNEARESVKENDQLISKAELKALYEAKKKKPSAGLTKKQKSTVAKKARAGKDIGKKGKGFEKIEKAAEKQYGDKETAKKVAAAAMWKNIKRK